MTYKNYCSTTTKTKKTVQKYQNTVPFPCSYLPPGHLTQQKGDDEI